MAIKKTELYSSLWASCDELRGGMDASQYKDYVLFMLFIKYISDKYADSDDFAPPVIIPKGASFKDMLALRGKDDIGDKINTQIIQSLINANARLARSDFPDFNDPNKLGEGNAKVERLTNLINTFNDPKLDFSKNRADHDDILGDAYEYLMRHFAQDSGKSKGQFYTPSEVSRVLAKVLGLNPKNAVAATTVYDPTCGSGSLLLKVAAEAGKHITLEGQEKDVTTAGLARMNMILHNFPTANIQTGDTLASPKFKEGERLRTYDYVVANPPFSDKKWSTGLTPSNDPYQRFEWGEPPAKQGDFAYLLHIIRSMNNSKGKAACILPHGVLFRGNAEATIRKELIRSGILKGIIGLPVNLFYGTGIPACILVLDKENAAARKGIFIIDASKGFIKDGNKNRLREQDIHKIVDTFRKGEKVNGYARMVPLEEIANEKNNYNLNLPRYIDSADSEDIQDIDGHLRGGIPQRDIDALQSYWKEMPGLRHNLFESAGRNGYLQLQMSIADIKSTILDHTEFTALKQTIAARLVSWSQSNISRLKHFDKDEQPKELIDTVSEELLSSFRGAPLLDCYDIYQHLMDLWANSMQDDCYIIAADGWKAEPRRIVEEVKSGKKKGEMQDKGWTCDLIPKPYIVARYFAKELAEINSLQAKLDEITVSLEALQEEHGVDDGVLKDVSSKGDAQEAYISALTAVWSEDDKQAFSRYSSLVEQAAAHSAELLTLTDHHLISVLKNKKGKLTLKAVKDQLSVAYDAEEIQVLQSFLAADQAQKQKSKQANTLLKQVEGGYLTLLKQQPDAAKLVDLQVAIQYIALLDKQSSLKSQIKVLEAELDDKAYAQYSKLTVDEIKTLVVDDKWIATLTQNIDAEIENVSQRLMIRIRQLAQRYANPLPKLVETVRLFSDVVEKHLSNMGVVK
ncbi:type I restriction-modification system subunit M [Vibrio parahaemolyticus]|uniref:type I restriction-modification system subunit M n=1 Tax=Vibrio parahaemolyticus TaxID=670 RepID=UPI001D9739E2|nr:type I restriction-modification system subunit M [Vibrio parahaemolyticus]EJG1724888.1 type I restriction-modification system subunit M [Vibrio parahaemolyticus]EJG1738364.1 type I restriction-modification system subunit M [Vibrio parahaemolyticus]EJG1752553.1 type I restriction-modification system subunit M [Vibrio parahaemolyticus]EJG1758496.1 type I restriction-modification system subunit M [Vibrio parahaemolyticus]UYW14623.1 type I restriction-modification system subunit M [Vibrio parah